MKTGVLIGIVVGVVVIGAALFMLFSGNDSEKDVSAGGDAGDWGGDDGGGDSGNLDCGTVSQAENEALFASPNPTKNDIHDCISKKLKDCSPGTATFEADTGDTALEVVNAEGSNCVVKYGFVDESQTMTCDFPKNVLEETYGAAEAQGAGWMTDVSISMIMGMEMTFGEAGPKTMDLTNQETGESRSADCE